MASQKKIDISMGVEALLENGFFYLEKKQWKLSKEYFEKVIEINPRNPKAYLGLLLVANKLPTPDSLPNSTKPFEKSNNYQSALRYGNEEFILQLKGYLDLYNAKREKEYQNACEKLEKSETRKDFEHCYETFCKLEKYKNSEAMAKKAKESIDILVYEDCLAKFDDNLTEEEYLELINMLCNIKYKDSENLYKKCFAHYHTLKEAQEENERKENTYRSICSLYNSASSIKDILSAKKSFESIADYKDSKDWILKCEDKLNSKKVAFLLYKIWNNNKLLVCIACTLVVLFGFIISNTLGYTIAMIISLGAGLFVALAIGNGKWIYAGRSLLIATVVGLLLALIVSTSSSGGGNSKGSGTCGICGGSGTVTTKFLGEGTGIKKGFDTYYRCKGCHGTGRD